VRRHNEQLQLMALSGAVGSVRHTAPQWQEPFSDGVGCLWFMEVYRWLLCRLTLELSGGEAVRLDELLDLTRVVCAQRWPDAAGWQP